MGVGCCWVCFSQNIIQSECCQWRECCRRDVSDGGLWGVLQPQRYAERVLPEEGVLLVGLVGRVLPGGWAPTTGVCKRKFWSVDSDDVNCLWSCADLNQSVQMPRCPDVLHKTCR